MLFIVTQFQGGFGGGGGKITLSLCPKRVVRAFGLLRKGN